MKLRLEMTLRIVTDDDEEEVADSYICASTPPVDSFFLEKLQTEEHRLHNMFLGLSEEPPFTKI